MLVTTAKRVHDGRIAQHLAEVPTIRAKTNAVWLGLMAVSSRHRGTMTECRRLTWCDLKRARWPLGLDCGHVPQMEEPA